MMIIEASHAVLIMRRLSHKRDMLRGAFSQMIREITGYFEVALSR